MLPVACIRCVRTAIYNLQAQSLLPAVDKTIAKSRRLCVILCPVVSPVDGLILASVSSGHCHCVCLNNSAAHTL